jgi:hypothetical protein
LTFNFLTVTHMPRLKNISARNHKKFGATVTLHFRPENESNHMERESKTHLMLKKWNEMKWKEKQRN